MSAQGNDADEVTPATLFGRRKIQHVFGGGKVENILLWRDPKVSAVVLLGVTLIWFLFEVVEYNFITFMCHISITIMLVFFIWCTLAEVFQWRVPHVPSNIVDESTIKEAAVEFHRRLNQFLSKLLDVACGKDLPTFLMVIGILVIVSIVGNYFTTLNLLYMSYLGLQILPKLYENYEEEIDNSAWEAYEWIKGLYEKFDSKILGKIPRRPAKTE